jgi:FAD/FMN-containing dehydrogenase
MAATFSLLLTLTVGGTVAWFEFGPEHPGTRVVRDVTQLIEVETDRVVAPPTIDALQRVVAAHHGPISIGGGRFSMGGQIATDGTLFLDMRQLDRIVSLDPKARVVQVEAGITWRKLIEAIDPHDLSVRIMQSYANFTVGGSLSVNAHGRYVNEGPVSHSVRSLDLMLADGSMLHCDRTENAELFWAAVGGYGAVGVIVRVELDLVTNQRMERKVDRMPVAELVPFFRREVQSDDKAVMFNADIYPPDYDDLVSIRYVETDKALTISDRLQAGGGPSAGERLVYWWVSDGPMGKQAREQVIDKLRLQSSEVLYRNYEASYDVASLEPKSREKKTYILQEYFIPVDNFDAFVPKMRAIFQQHDVNVLNVSIRHATAEPDSLLTWAPRECFAFVVYHQMRTTPEAWQHAETWTRAMLDEVIAAEGRWYLPYQIHGTTDQFAAAYPGAEALFALKRQVDPDYTFRNRLLDAYLPPTTEYGGVRDEAALRARLTARPTWARFEDQTFLTLPEWMIVYSADETGSFLKTHRPSEFPWFASVGQFWTIYRAVWARVRADHPFNTGYHLMIGVIGTSYTIEYAGKGAYEALIGRWFEGAQRVPEEDAYAQITSDYGAFIHHTPWYAFPFPTMRARLAAVDGPGLRGTERQFALRAELSLKAWWASLIGFGTGAAYDPQAATVEAWARGVPADVAAIAGVTVMEQLGPDDMLISVPRYEPFTAAAIALAAHGVELVEVAGGDRILVQVNAPSTWEEGALWGDVLIKWPLLSDPTRTRWALEVPVRRLDEALPAIVASGATIEHLYDY